MTLKLFHTVAFFIFIPLALSSSSRTWISPQENKDLKSQLTKSISKAQNEIYISVYDLTDKDLIKSLNAKAEEGAIVQIWTDRKNSKKIQKKLSDKIHLKTRKQSGLMHHKLFILDREVFIGSSNLTPTSLRMHSNLTVHTKDFVLAHSFKKILNSSAKKLSYKTPEAEYFFLPSQRALKAVLQAIHVATHEILVAQFTFTHPQIAQALIEAHKKGVKVKVLIDRHSSQGASHKTATILNNAQVPTYTNKGVELMHHKICLIDQKTLLFGSSNWTKSAFEKNYDLLVKTQITDKESRAIKKLFYHLFCESSPYNE